MNKESYAHYVASLAQRAILYEVSVSPKPGLVDRENNGAHNDMNFFTFLSSSSSLYKGLYEFTMAGINFKEKNISKLLNNIRPIGIDCEKAMFDATKGINTHKGIIFSFGILCATIGYLYEKKHKEIFLAEEVTSVVKDMTKDLVTKDFYNLDFKKNLTHGEYLYKAYGLKGIRGEVESGFKTVISKPISIIRQWDTNKNLSKNDLFLEVLLYIISSSEDTNIVTRGGINSLKYVKDTSKRFLENGGMKQSNAKKILNSINDSFVKMNISPGGSADLLAVTIFLALIENITL
ncbi:triphosphoribosyl-dephospho-CoA synthase CitG [Clostridium sp. D2Q-14]|uniref:triphosphoribosyl-dephospho-CoA synthase CitG n=1 Tax=Anaeromonas gelatinilytica TaxID=2683194 RepID=UPI00193C7D1C|nr:triphosphoribosyl-dephospho-CoA synthase CitG [Anaeromonas gelatinilytica]MBS4534741.1 triphosphoribosyl-dephospho-CoA synthase CitG [Anaeromonas gelatinilytica]